MTIPAFNKDNFGSDCPVAIIGDGEAGADIELLHKVSVIIDAASLGEEFEDARFEVPLTVVITGEVASDSLAPALDKMRLPLRLICGAEERFLANNDSDDAARLNHLLAAIDSCRTEAGSTVRVVIQEVAGRARGDRYYPNISGVLLSENYYPISYMKPIEGVAYATLGLGTGNRMSMRSLRFSPLYPELMPDFSLPADIVKNSQRDFHAVDLSDTAGEGAPAHDPAQFELQAALEDGTLAPVGGVYSMENQMIYPGVHRDGIKVVTFASMLRGNIFPLAAILHRLHGLLARKIAEPLAVRYSVNLKSLKEKAAEDHFFIEAVTRQRHAPGNAPLDLDNLESLGPKAICCSNASLGNGRFRGVRDIVCVCPDRLDISRSHEIAEEVGRFNESLANEGRPYILIGSGRWGTTDKYLGIPITWHQVFGAHIQVEAGIEDFNIEASRGTHFFRELTFHERGTMHITLQRPGDAIDWEWLQSAPTESPGSDGTFVRHLSFDEPLRIEIDGRTGRGAIMKPGN